MTGDVTPPPLEAGGLRAGCASRRWRRVALRWGAKWKSCFTVGGEVAWAARNAADLCEQRGEEAHLVAAPHALRRVHGA